MKKFFLIAVIFIVTTNGCGASGPAQQVFPAPTPEFEEAFNRWVDQMGHDSINSEAVVWRISEWMKDNMKYAPGRKWDDWPGYQSWGQSVNCNGHAQVAIECLYRLGYKDYVLFVVSFPGNWHVWCTNKKVWVSNDGWGQIFNKSYSEMAALMHSQWYWYKVYDRNLKLLEEGSNPAHKLSPVLAE